MSGSCSDLIQDLIVKASKFFVIPEKLRYVLRVLLGLGLFACLVASILVTIHSAFSRPTHWFPFPDRLNYAQSFSHLDYGQTNISHILFGLGGSVSTWHERSSYSNLWWDANATRGFVWFDKEPKNSVPECKLSVPYRISEDCSRFKYTSSQSAVRIARIVYESFKLELPNVRWFVMGDDDTVFFTENLVAVLSKYDHKQMYYIGGRSESVEQDVMHSYEMAFGGGGFAISYPLAAQLFRLLDTCLDKYYYFYGSDQRVAACVSEVGVPLTHEKGFHQFDIRGDANGLLAAHPLAALVSLHHLDYTNPLFPNQTQVESVETLMSAYQVDSSRTLQQSICYHRKHEWSISIAWGYTVQVYTSILTPNELEMPLQTFRTWRSSSQGPFTFNTRAVSPDPCQRPIPFFLSRAEEVGKRGTLTAYTKYTVNEASICEKANHYARGLNQIVVSAMKLDSEYWKKVSLSFGRQNLYRHLIIADNFYRYAIVGFEINNMAPRRQCCEIMDKGKIKGGILHIGIRNCRTREVISA